MKKKIIISLILVFLLAAGLFILLIYLENHQLIKTSRNKLYSISYYKTWQIEEQSPEYIRFSHETDSFIEIKITKLTAAQKNQGLKETLGDVKYNFEQAMPNYQLINNVQQSITKHQYPGYQLLYQTSNDEVLIAVTKNSDYLIVFSYNAPTSYFDILLDNFRYIEENFELLPTNYALTEIKIPITGINYLKSDRDDNEKEEYVINSNHYEVSYQVPKLCQLNTFDTTSGYLTCEEVTIQVRNVYQNLISLITDPAIYGGIAQEIKYYQEHADFENVVVENEKTSNGYNYKISYDNKKQNRYYEKLYILTSLDYLRTNIIKIEVKDQKLEKNFVEQVRVIKFTKYGANINKELKDGYLFDSLKIFIDSNAKERQYYEAIYQIPGHYEEIDYDNNQNNDRYFQVGYNEVTNKYDYQINLQITKYGDSATEVANLEKDYQLKPTDTFIKKGNLGDQNQFNYYEGIVIENNKTSYQAYLFLDLEKGGFIKTVITSSIKPIPVTLVADFTNISVTIKENGDRK